MECFVSPLVVSSHNASVHPVPSVSDGATMITTSNPSPHRWPHQQPQQLLLRRTQALNRSRVVVALASTDSSGSGPAGSDGSFPNKDPSSLIDRIAHAFVDACTPSTTPYVAQLARFCKEALAAYQAGYTLVALQLELAGASTTGIGRALASDEIELRSVWLALVYKTLRQIRFPSTASNDPSPAAQPSGFDRDRMDEFVSNIVAAVRRGYDMKRIQLEQALRSSSAEEGGRRSPLESAILNQSTRIVITTLQVADEALESPS